MEARIKRIVSEFSPLGHDFTDVDVEKLEDGSFRINITSEDPSLLIGHHGEKPEGNAKHS